MESINQFKRFVENLKFDSLDTIFVKDELKMYIEWIEGEHARLMQQAIDKAYAECEVVKNECSDMRDFCKRLEEAAKKHEDVTLFDVDYTALPIDIDREAWHVDDFVVGELNPNNPQKVKRMLWYGPDLGWRLETDDIIFSYPERLRHYHKSTIEDILKEYCIKYYNLMTSIKDKSITGKEYTQAIEALDAEYVQKLQNWSEND